MKIATGSLHRYCLTLLVVLPWYSPVSAQDADKDGEFFVSFAGSAVFPYDPKGQSGTGGEGVNFKAGGGFTAAFGYAFKEGFSTEIEWGYQKVGIGNPIGNLFQASGWQARAGRVGGVIFEGFEIPFPSITIENDGEIKTHSLMGNVYYRYPKWRVSPYAGFGLGAFFHDGAFTSTVTVESELGTIGLPNIELPTIGFPAEPLRTTGLPIRSWQASRLGSPRAWSSTLAIASDRAGGRRSMPTRSRQASDSGFDSTLRNGGHRSSY